MLATKNLLLCGAALTPAVFRREREMVSPILASCLHLDVVADDAHVERIDSEARVVGPFAVGHAEAPGMPRASHGALFI